jgi:hypothetical protein
MFRNQELKQKNDETRNGAKIVPCLLSFVFPHFNEFVSIRG